MESLFKTEKGKAEIFALYDQKLEQLNLDVDYLSVTTSFGVTNVLRTGDITQPPIVVVHGSNACAPIALEFYPNLASSFCVYAVDVLAQPNKSSETRLSMKDHSYGKWMDEVMEQLELSMVTMAGFSFGGLVILKTLEYNENRVKEVFLTSPAYIVNGNPIVALLKMFVPIRRYMATRKVKFVEKFLLELFTEKDSFALQYLSRVFLEFKMDFTPVPVIDSKNAQRITRPISIYASDKDLIFPGKKMLKRAVKIFPSLKKWKLLENSKHVPSKKHNTFIENEILAKW